MTNLDKDRFVAKIKFLESQKELKEQIIQVGVSILDMALELGVNLDHACGGVCACSTCHVIIEKGFSSCGEASEEEEDQLEKAPGITMTSRLACQCYPDGLEDIVVQIPEWNRNLVRE